MRLTRACLPLIVVALIAPAGGCGSSGGEQATDDGAAGGGGTAGSGGGGTAGAGGGGTAGAGAGGTAGAPPPPVDVVAAGVRWVGRVDTTDATRPRFSWSGTGFVARFMGTSLSAQLATTGAIQIFKTVIDGAPQAPFSAGVGSKSYDLATGLSADAAHTVELYRQSEGSQGETQLVALTVPDGTLMDPPPGPGRLIEVIGDSITCGFGDLSSIDDLNAPGTKCLTTESHWDTYEAVAARALGAEVSTIAISGKGVIRNYGGDTTTPTMPMYYGYTLTNVATPAWDFHIQPQAVVINLGTNDDSNGDPGTAYRDGYVTLLETVRAKYINALIVGIIAPMVNGGQLTVMQGYIQAAVDTRHAAGDANVEFLAIPAQTSAGYACDYHPNVAEHAMMGEMLTAELRAKLGW